MRRSAQRGGEPDRTPAEALAKPDESGGLTGPLEQSADPTPAGAAPLEELEVGVALARAIVALEELPHLLAARIALELRGRRGPSLASV